MRADLTNPMFSDDIGTRAQAILESIAAKQASRPEVDHNGRPVDPDRIRWKYDGHGKPVRPANDTEQET